MADFNLSVFNAGYLFCKDNDNKCPRLTFMMLFLRDETFLT